MIILAQLTWPKKPGYHVSRYLVWYTHCVLMVKFIHVIGLIMCLSITGCHCPCGEICNVLNANPCIFSLDRVYYLYNKSQLCAGRGFWVESISAVNVQILSWSRNILSSVSSLTHIKSICLSTILAAIGGGKGKGVATRLTVVQLTKINKLALTAIFISVFILHAP